MKKAVALAPDGWIPGGKPDPLIHHKHGLIGAAISRIDGPVKVSGKAEFCAAFPIAGLAYAALNTRRSRAAYRRDRRSSAEAAPASSW